MCQELFTWGHSPGTIYRSFVSDERDSSQEIGNQDRVDEDKMTADVVVGRLINVAYPLVLLRQKVASDELRASRSDVVE